MLFLSAGHHLTDPGAPSVVSGETEAMYTMELRNMINAELKRIGQPCINDADHETLAQYLGRIKSGSGSVVCEIHFNASNLPQATGIEVLVPANPDPSEMRFASQLCETGARIMGIANRGVKTEAESHRGSLALMRKAGINLLIEVCFISNQKDVDAYKLSKQKLANAWAVILKNADDFIA